MMGDCHEAFSIGVSMTRRAEYSYECKKCNNTSKFYASATELHTWLVDGQGTFVSDLSCDDAELGQVIVCAQCGTHEVAWTEQISPMASLKEQLLKEA